MAPTFRNALLQNPKDALRRRIVGEVRSFFNEDTGGAATEAGARKPVPPSDAALFAPDTPIRMVHADVVGMMVGGISALFLQMLHPHALQGVLDHSDFRADMHGRLTRTARFISVTTFGHRDEAARVIARVNRIHDHVNGTLPDGTPYSARDPRVLAWVHVTEAMSFLAAYRRIVRPAMPGAQQDEYFRQFATVARALGADPVPESRGEADAVFRDLRRDCQGTAEAREVARFVAEIKPDTVPPALQAMLMNEAVALLPPFARTMLALPRPTVTALPSRLGVWGMGRTLRWAFGQG